MSRRLPLSRATLWYPAAVAVLLLVGAGSGSAGTGPWTLPLNELEQPRTVADWLAWPELRAMMAALEEAPESRLLIRHPGGDRGGFRAHWLAGQLVALGLPWARIELRPGGVAAGQVELRVLTSVDDRT